jgi:hypothetical protein
MLVPPFITVAVGCTERAADDLFFTTRAEVLAGGVSSEPDTAVVFFGRPEIFMIDGMVSRGKARASVTETSASCVAS